MNSTLLAYLQLARIPALFTAISNILAAHLIATGGDIRWRELIILCAISGCLYIAGMVLNDYFDLEYDSKERPDRPLPSHAIPARNALIIGIALLCIGIILSSYIGWLTVIVTIILALTVVFYDKFASKNALGPLIMATCRYLNWMLGFSFVALTPDRFLIAAPIFFYVLALTLVSSQETRADHKPAIWRAWSIMFAAVVLFLYLLYSGLLHSQLSGLVAVVLFVLLSVQFYRVLKTYTPQTIQQLVKVMIIGIIPLDCLMVLAGGPWWGSLILVLLIIPSKLLARKIYIT